MVRAPKDSSLLVRIWHPEQDKGTIKRPGTGLHPRPRSKENTQMMKKLKKIIAVLFVLAGSSTMVIAQQGFGTNAPDRSAVVDMTATNKGVLFPRVALTSTILAAPITSPATNLVVFNTATAGDVTPGLYYWNGTAWIRLLAHGDMAPAWNLTGNAGTTPGTHFVGTTVAKDQVFGTTNTGRLIVKTGGNVGIGTSAPVGTALLDVTSTSQGFLPPRLNADQIAAIVNPVEGLIVYNTTRQCLAYYAKGAFTCAFGVAAPPPVASSVAVLGDVVVGQNLTASYIYSQSTGFSEGATRYQWYIANDAGGGGKIAISGANAITYLAASPVAPGKYVAVGVMPVTTTGVEGLQVLSPWRVVAPNAAPYFMSVTNSISDLYTGDDATVVVDYKDDENDLPDTHTYQWYRYSTPYGTVTPIAGATSANYNVSLSDVGYYIRAGARAVAKTGKITGNEQFASTFLGPFVAWACGNPITKTHIAGPVAPETKTITYGTVLSSLSGASHCWITQNLGADYQALSAIDRGQNCSGWYWQFNRNQGYHTIDLDLTPSSWEPNGDQNDVIWAAPDPCTVLLGAGWRLPKSAEWDYVDDTWHNYTEAYNSVLKFHMAGYMAPACGFQYFGGEGKYWAGDNKSKANGYSLDLSSSKAKSSYDLKGFGCPLRCMQ